MRLAPKTLFARQWLTLAGFTISFQIVSMAIIAYLMLFPIGQRAAADLAAIMFHAADVWMESPAAQRPAFERDMVRNHQLVMGEADQSLRRNSSWLPYLYFLESELQKRQGYALPLYATRDDEGEQWFWVDIPRGETRVRIGFARNRIGVEPPLAFFLVISLWLLMTMGTAIILARRLNRPLDTLAAVARRIGHGEWPEPVPEDGPEELAALARSFNRMNHQVRELLANRTTLLAGISHDLRTPLARMQLAVAMLPGDVDHQLVRGLERDMGEMNRLIGEFIEISRGLHHDHSEMVDIPVVLEELVQKARHSGAEIVWQPAGACTRTLHRLALCRVLGNLLENAVRYGAGQPVEVGYSCDRGVLRIRILDRGPGIPRDQYQAVFQPFHRLEQSRSSATGGSGLGLTIARQLATQHGWEIALRPRPGGGIEARVEIPPGSPD